MAFDSMSKVQELLFGKLFNAAICDGFKGRITDRSLYDRDTI